MDYSAIGLVIVPDFITASQEQEILSHLTREEHQNSVCRNSIKRYGSGLPYNKNIVSKNIPEFLDGLSERLYREKFLLEKPNSVTINEYQTGQGIFPHVDSQNSGPVITILSLLGKCVMLFQRAKYEFSITYPPRCLVQLKDEIRYDWLHSVPPVTEDRFSLVFRCA